MEKSKNKNVGITITDSEIRRRYDKYTKLIGSLRGERRPEILPFGRADQEIASKGNGYVTKDSRPEIGQAVRKYETDGISPPLNNWSPLIIHPTLTEAIGRQGSSKEYIKSLKQINKCVSDAQRIFDTSGISTTLKSLGGGQGAKTGLYAMPLKFMGRNQKNLQGEYSFTIDGANTGGIMTVANTLTPDAYLTSGKRKRVNGKAVLTSMHERRIRRLTPTECERLQGFPDGWTDGLSDSQKYKQMGNAVTVNVIEAIMKNLLNNA